MGELSTEFNWEAAVNELNKKYITFNLIPECQDASDKLLLEKIDGWFRFNFQNNEINPQEFFSIYNILIEIQEHNYDVLLSLYDILIDHSPDYEEARKSIKSQDDKETTIDDFVSWHYEGESYEIYCSDFGELEVYDNLAKYICDTMAQEGIMFKLDSDIMSTGSFPRDCDIYCNNCQNSLLSEFSIQKTYDLCFDKEIGFLIVPKITKDTILAIGGCTNG